MFIKFSSSWNTYIYICVTFMETHFWFLPESSSNLPFAVWCKSRWNATQLCSRPIPNKGAVGAAGAWHRLVFAQTSRISGFIYTEVGAGDRKRPLKWEGFLNGWKYLARDIRVLTLWQNKILKIISISQVLCSGEYSCLQVNLTFARQLSFFIVTVCNSYCFKYHISNITF